MDGKIEWIKIGCWMYNKLIIRLRLLLKKIGRIYWTMLVKGTIVMD